MAAELSKTYDPAAVEPEAYRVWLEERAFEGNPNTDQPPYSIVIPPPNVTGALHLGHAINNTLQDILTRKARMEGKAALWIPGIDHAGIATQAVVEKQLKEKENKTRHDVGREGLVERIWTWKEQYGDRILEQLKRMGCSCDWSRTRFTLDETLARAVRHTFFKLFKDGLIYRGKRLVNWDVHLQTSISDDEIYHETVKTSLWHIAYPIVDEGGIPLLHPDHQKALQRLKQRNEQADAAGNPRLFATYPRARMVVATTRPETMLGDTAVAVHSQDPRWNWAIGKHVRLPLVNRLIPIIADDILVDPKFGSGVVKVTPAHDPNDYAVWQRHQGQHDQIDLINILNPDGTINDAGGPYRGMKRDAARKKVVEDLTAQGLLVKEEPHEAQVGHSDRSKTAVEPYLSDQWFVKMAPLAEAALRVVRDGTIKFFPERHAQQYLAWLGEKRDWPISRQLWWGHQIPVWSRTDTYMRSLPDAVFNAMKNSGKFNQTVDLGANKEPNVQRWHSLGCASRWELHEDKSSTRYICVPPLGGEVEARIYRELEEAGYTQDPDVLDTWFSSALWPHSTLGWPDDTPDLRKWYPTSVLVTGRDIITLWVARMVMTGLYNMSDHPSLRGTGFQPVKQDHGLKAHATTDDCIAYTPAAIPFHHVAINPTILDGKGERMSKSKGNGVDPVDIIDSHGADAMRFTLTQMATETQDARLPVKKLPNGKNTSEKFDVGRNFCNKLWNAARFALSNLESIPPEPVDETKWSMADRWIVSRFNRTVQECNDALGNYRFDQYARACYDFFWRDFCDWYIEAIKPDWKNPQRAGQVANVLAAVLDGSLRLMHPMIPFITETVWWRLSEVRQERGLPGRIMGCTSKRLILAAWPTVGDCSEAAEHIFPRLQEIVVAIRNLRNEYKVDPKKAVTVSIAAPGDSARQIEANRTIIETLGMCSLKEVRADLLAPPNTARAMAAGCEIFIEGLIDPEAERQRLGKKREELIKQINALRGRLSNESYTAKAPPHLVKQTQDQLAQAETELEKLG